MQFGDGDKDGQVPDVLDIRTHPHLLAPNMDSQHFSQSILLTPLETLAISKQHLHTEYENRRGHE